MREADAHRRRNTPRHAMPAYGAVAIRCRNAIVAVTTAAPQPRRDAAYDTPEICQRIASHAMIIFRLR